MSVVEIPPIPTYDGSDVPIQVRDRFRRTGDGSEVVADVNGLLYDPTRGCYQVGYLEAGNLLQWFDVGAGSGYRVEKIERPDVRVEVEFPAGLWEQIGDRAASLRIYLSDDGDDRDTVMQDEALVADRIVAAVLAVIETSEVPS